MQHAADQGLIGDTLLQGPRAYCLEIAAGEPDVDALILMARCPGGLTQRLEHPRCGNTAPFTGVVVAQQRLLF